MHCIVRYVIVSKIPFGEERSFMTKEKYREGNTFYTVVAIINDLKEKTDELGFGVESLTYTRDMQFKFIEEDRLIEAAIVATYIETNFEEEDRFECNKKTKAIALELGLETADRYTQE